MSSAGLMPCQSLSLKFGPAHSALSPIWNFQPLSSNIPSGGSCCMRTGLLSALPCCAATTREYNNMKRERHFLIPGLEVVAQQKIQKALDLRCTEGPCS